MNWAAMEAKRKGNDNWARWKGPKPNRNVAVSSLPQDSWPDSPAQKLPAENWYDPVAMSSSLPLKNSGNDSDWPTLGQATSSGLKLTEKPKRVRAKNKNRLKLSESHSKSTGPNKNGSAVEMPPEKVGMKLIGQSVSQDSNNSQLIARNVSKKQLLSHTTSKDKSLSQGLDDVATDKLMDIAAENISSKSTTTDKQASPVCRKSPKDLKFVNTHLTILKNPTHNQDCDTYSDSPRLKKSPKESPKRNFRAGKRPQLKQQLSESYRAPVMRVEVNRCLADIKSCPVEEFLQDVTLDEGFFNFRDFFIRVRDKTNGSHVMATMGDITREMLYDTNTSLKECRRDMGLMLKALLGFRFTKIAAKDKIQSNFSPLTIQFLAKEFIHVMKKPNKRFPDAKLFCSICDYHMAGVDHAYQHLKGPDHEKFKKDKLLIEQLHLIPEPCEAQLDALTNVVKNISEKYGRSREELAMCHTLTQALTHLVKNQIHPECEVHMYGSCLIGTALKTSNLNLQLIYPEQQMSHAFALKAFHALIQMQTVLIVSDVEAHYEARWPSVTFKPVGLDVLCVVSVQNDMACRVNSLVTTYAQLRPEIIPLGQAWRYWAKSCDLCEFKTSGFPAYAYDLMLIYYLQQLKPAILPVVQELPRNPGEDYETDINKLKEYFSEWNDSLHLGRLWYGLFRFYVMEDHQSTVICIQQSKLMLREDKSWNKKRIGIEDPYAPSRNVVNLTPRMYDYFFSCLCKSYCYFSIPRNVQGPLYSFEDCRIQHSTLYRKEIANVETPQDEQSEFEPDLAKNGEIVSNASPVKSPDEVTEESEPSEISTEKSPESPNKLATLERVYTRAEMDQICQQVISRNQLFTLPFDCSILERRPNILYSVHGTLKNIVPVIAKSAIAESQVVYCPITTEALPTNGCEIDSNEQSFPRNEEQLLEEKSSEKLTIQPLQSYESVDSEKPDQINADDDDSIIFALPSEELADLEDKMNEVSLQEKGETANNDCEKGFQKSMGSLSDEDQKEMNSIVAKFSLLAQTMKPHEFHFDFITDDLVGGKKPMMVCSYCQGEHAADVCPQEELPPLAQLPLLFPYYQNMMSQFLGDIPKKYCMTPARIQFQHNFCSALEELLQVEYRSDCQLRLFGSAVNNFGFDDSDVDLCLTFAEPSLPSDVDPIKAIKKVAKILQQKANGVYGVTAVTKAKVPIVKCVHRYTGRDIDVSLYNTLAVRNSHMISLYAKIDQRAWALGYIVKRFAKECDIGDASKGSLSSYAYILMVIHYLQQRNPPVLPCLQQICKDPNMAQNFVIDRWDTYFYDNIEMLPFLWTEYKKNEESLCSLWVGFLRYYTEEFDFERHVICIRQLEPLLKFEKLWSDRKMAIEDPFNLNHNLASGLSRRMFNYIQKALIRGRNLFGYALSPVALSAKFGDAIGFDQLESYYFGPNLKPKQGPPRDRVCHKCGHVGHFVEQCPKNSNRVVNPNDGLDSDSDTEVEKEIPLG